MADIEDIPAIIESTVKEITQKITSELPSRGYRAANELRNASQEILRGGRGGRSYRVPGTKARYTASAPGEPPAVRTGAFRASWQPKTETTGSGDNLSVRSYIESNARTDNGSYVLGSILEEGTSKMAPRPHHEKIQKEALPKIKQIYEEPYL